MRWYKMGKNHKVIPAKSVEDWGSFREEHRRVAEDTINGLWVSTVFLGLDHNFGDGPPIVFETMVFPNENDLGDRYKERYATWNEAVAGHERVCDMVRSGAIT